MYIAYKRQPSLNKNHVQTDDVRPVKSKQNCALSEKGWIARKIIKNTGNKKEKAKAKNQMRTLDYRKIQTNQSQ